MTDDVSAPSDAPLVEGETKKDGVKGFEDLLPLSRAAQIAPGRPSSNCVWRWCRRGLRPRAGERVYLRHVRVGGKVYTSREWLEDFGQALAEADAAYFRRAEDDASQPDPRVQPKRRRKRFEHHRRQTIDQATRELEDAGL